MMTTPARAAKVGQRLRVNQREQDDLAAACWADYWVFCEYVKTTWEEAPGKPVVMKYPAHYEFLRRYHDFYALPESGLFGVDKPRGMIVTTDPLVWSLWESLRCAALGEEHKWRASVIRQSKPDAEELINRITAIYDLLPPNDEFPNLNLRLPLEKRNEDELRVRGGGRIVAHHAKGTAGRGEYWDVVLLDEGAYQERLRQNIAAFARAKRKLIPSTPNGSGNTFYDLMHGEYSGARLFHLTLADHPDRVPGTVDGDKYINEKRSEMSEVDFRREYLVDYEAIGEGGLFVADWSEDCIVDELEWDGKAPIIVSFDPGYWGSGASIRWFNEHNQDCRRKVFLGVEKRSEEFAREVCEWAKARWPKAKYLLTGDVAARQERSDSKDTDERIIIREASKILGECEYDHNGLWLSGETLAYQTHRITLDVKSERAGKKRGPRRRGHELVRQGFHVRPGDGRRGTLIHREGCRLLIQAFRGAYRLQDNPSPTQEENEEPDRSQDCVHVVDADRYGLMQFAVTGGMQRYASSVMGKKRQPAGQVLSPTDRWMMGVEA
jgi:hypothetical protein